MSELLSKSDYISLNVPYMPATHHLLGEEELKLLKPNCHIVNFARGELVNSEALRRMYDGGNFHGKYISDFADPHLHGHPKLIMLPHLGASTAEAEDNSASMAAKTVQSFLTSGVVENSVNFPTAKLNWLDKAARLCISHHNTPGMLGRISTYLGQQEINIAQQLNMSRDQVAYTVVDIETSPAHPDTIQQGLGQIPGVMSSRFIGNPFQDEFGQPGKFYRIYTNNYRSVDC